MSSEGYPELHPSEVITIALIETFSETTGQKTPAIHCMQWNSSCQVWDIENQLIGDPIEIHGLEWR